MVNVSVQSSAGKRCLVSCAYVDGSNLLQLNWDPCWDLGVEATLPRLRLGLAGPLPYTEQHLTLLLVCTLLTCGFKPLHWMPSLM